MRAPQLCFVDATLPLIDAALAETSRLAALLQAEIADDWTVFPDALPALREMIGGQPEGHAWGTILFLLREPRTLVGMGGYKGAPSPEGVVEIGYAIAPAFRRRGLATEAARWMVERAFAEPRVLAVDAHTLAEESHSTRVLGALGMVRIGEPVDPDEGPLWHWRLERPGHRGAGAPG